MLYKELFFFLVRDDLPIPPTQCLLHADYKDHKTMAPKCIISRGRLLSLLGEDKESHPRGCCPDRGRSLLSRGCGVGRRDAAVPEAHRRQRWPGAEGDGCARVCSRLTASEEGPIKRNP